MDTPKSTAMLRAERLYKSYDKLTVLKGIDLEVKPGEVVAVVGSSGAGKSTLLHVLGTLAKPEKGRLYLDGTDVFAQHSDRIADFRNRRLGFVFQFHNLLPEFSALENIMLPGLIAGDTEATVRQRARRLIDRLGLTARADHKPSQLSGGEQQRAAVARALINEPALVLADEPSGNLDSVHAGQLHRLFFELKEEMGHTFVIVTHNESFADMADRKLIMRDGLLDENSSQPTAMHKNM